MNNGHLGTWLPELIHMCIMDCAELERSACSQRRGAGPLEKGGGRSEGHISGVWQPSR